MSLTDGIIVQLPSVGDTIGPDWAFELNTALEVIAAHNHSGSGQGFAIPTNGININSDLPLNNYNLSLPRAVRLTNNGSAINTPSDSTTIYALNGELWYNDAASNLVQITAGGSINASSLGAIGGDYGSSTALLAYYNLTESFVFTKDTLEAATIDCGPVIIRNTAASAKGITLQSPVGLAADYGFTLPPALPASNDSLLRFSAAGVASYYDIGSFVVDSGNSGSGLVNLSLSGNLDAVDGDFSGLVNGLTLTTINIGTTQTLTLDNGATHGGRVNFDGGTTSYLGSDATGLILQIVGFTSAVVPAGVANSVVAATTRSTGTSVGAGGVAISNSSGSFTRTGNTFGDVTNLSVSITTSGRPIKVFIEPDSSSSNFSFIGLDDVVGASDSWSGEIQVLRGVTHIGSSLFTVTAGAGTIVGASTGCSISFTDVVSAGTYTYKVQARRAGSDSSGMTVDFYRLVVYEL